MAAPVAGVEVSTDGGARWHPARLEPQPSPWAWASWSFTWEATPGSYELCSRATDAAGNTQPLEAPWNTGGYANNAVQRVPVTVTGDFVAGQFIPVTLSFSHGEQVSLKVPAGPGLGVAVDEEALAEVTVEVLG